MVNFGLVAAEICWRVWGTPVNFNGFRVLGALLHGIQQWASAKLCGVEQRAPPIFDRAAITLGIGPHFQLLLLNFRRSYFTRDFKSHIISSSYMDTCFIQRRCNTWLTFSTNCLVCFYHISSYTTIMQGWYLANFQSFAVGNEFKNLRHERCCKTFRQDKIGMIHAGNTVFLADITSGRECTCVAENTTKCLESIASQYVSMSLWSPYVIGQTIIFSSCFFLLLLLFLLSSFFPRLISAVGDWMFTILWYMVWPQCEFRMQV